MKNRIRSIGTKVIGLFIALFSTINLFAQDAVDNTRVSVWKFSVYSGYFPVLVFGAVIAFLAFMSYKYWKDNVTDDHMPHHQ